MGSDLNADLIIGVCTIVLLLLGYLCLRMPFVHALTFCFECAEKLLVILRDGRKIIGILRSFDQFGKWVFSPCNLVARMYLCHIIE